MTFPAIHSNTSILKSLITHLYFILNRNQEQAVRHLIREIFDQLKKNERDIFYETLLRNVVSHTRNIQRGKGERRVFYVCVVEWFYYDPNQAFDLIDSLVYKPLDESFDIKPYGSWRDIRGIAEYVYRDETIKHPLIQYCVFLLNYQLTSDYTYYLIPPGTISNVVKWIPRERAKWNWLFYALVEQWSPLLFRANKNKACMEYRKMCSKLNAHLSTLTFSEKRSGFHYCPRKLVAFSLVPGNMYSADLAWQQAMEKQRGVFGKFSNVLCMIDARLEGEHMHSAIGLSLAIGETSSFGKRVLCMGHNPAWIAVPDEYGLTLSVSHVAACLSVEPLCRIEKSIGLLIQSFAESEMTSAEIEQVCLVIFSGMDFGEVVLHDIIQSMFRLHSMQMPHFVYWGIGASVLPCAFDTPRATLVSGESSCGFHMLRDMDLVERRNWYPYISIRRNL
jgi:hypothetical protein